MEWNFPRVSYSMKYGLDFPHSVAAKAKAMDHQEPTAAAPMHGFVTNTKSKYEDPRTDSADSLPPARVPRKRKEYHEMDGTAFDTTMFDRKRVRHNNLRASKSKEVFKPPKGGSFKVDMGGGEKLIGISKHVLPSGCPRGAFHLYDGLIKSDRVLHIDSGASETSVASSDDAGDDKRSVGNTSTLTSNEDGDSRIMSFPQVSKSVQASNCVARYSASSKDDAFTGIVRQDITGAHAPSSGHQAFRTKHTRKAADAEVSSGPFKKNLSSYSARELELNRVFGAGLWDSQYEESVEERCKAGAVDPGCSEGGGNESIRDSIERGADVRSSKLKQPYDKYALGNSSREYQSSSVVTDLCASSGSVSLWLEGGNSLKPYHEFKAGFPTTNITSSTKAVDKAPVVTPVEKAVHLTPVQEEQHTTSRSQYTSSRSEGTHNSRSQYTSSRSEGTHAASISLVREPVAITQNVSTGRDDCSSGSGSGGSESNKPEPTFVLSSGRLSKTQEALVGKRPTTIDDDFDEYFAQLML